MLDAAQHRQVFQVLRGLGGDPSGSPECGDGGLGGVVSAPVSAHGSFADAEVSRGAACGELRCSQ
jgi:hypothetical protein